jgi:hypothetical protein
MKPRFLKEFATLFAIAVLISGCSEFDYEDVGAIQYEEKQFALTDFDRLEVSDALIIRIEQGNYFGVSARGDRRNISDLSVSKSGNTLVVRFDEPGNRKHETYIDIVMPVVVSANLSGATNTVIAGFTSLESLSTSLSGASVAQLDIKANQLVVNLSGASVMDLRGTADQVTAEISGASSLKAFGCQVTLANLTVTGASASKVRVTDLLKATVTGASSVIYRGNPTIESNVTGASSIIKDVD